MDLSQRALQTNGKLFSKFQILFWSFGQKPKNIEKNSKAWILIKLQCALYQLFRPNKLYKHTISFFFKFNSFRNFGRNPKNIQTNSEASILIKLQCVVYQWIILDELFKLMKFFFFLISGFFFLFSCNFLIEYWRCVYASEVGEAFVLNSRRYSFCVIYSLCDIFYVIYSYRQDIKNERKWAEQHTAQIISRSNWFINSHNTAHPH